jgi:SulP family sulfate permease
MPTTADRAAPRAGGTARRRASWWQEASGSVADLGVLVPIAVTLVVVNGLAATAVLLPAAVGYLVVAVVYRVPVAVQPLKAFGAAAIAAGAGPDVIAAGSLLMGAVFLALGLTGLLDRVAAVFPVPVIRGVQLAVGLTFVKIAWGLVDHPPAAFTDQLTPGWTAVIAAVTAVVLLRWRQRLLLGAVLAALVTAVVLAGRHTALVLGPQPVTVPSISATDLATAAVLLVLPQLPLTFANSCLAPADAARRYFGAAGRRVAPGRLARTLGAVNLLAGGISGMPVCHGAGGMSAHVSGGARTWRAPLLIGAALLVAALGFGSAAAAALAAFPLGVLAALLLLAAVAHIALLRDLRGPWAWSLAVLTGVAGVMTNLAWAVGGALLLAWLARRLGWTSNY